MTFRLLITAVLCVISLFLMLVAVAFASMLGLSDRENGKSQEANRLFLFLLGWGILQAGSSILPLFLIGDILETSQIFYSLKIYLTVTVIGAGGYGFLARKEIQQFFRND
ncbi:hypothetical protein NG798_15580 [Ancylothrix sp. C2]|uniref:hypothetical protein n=1 Tax=Ancylothrix sp. D3o TaxID=2953691 RepID=UPI0021BB6136|nr:hypothetical protein [Ancylothrix sp. D3o]MCT7951220.1 hypothetical protein [Ancylothrix sp. D3o]